MDEESLVGRMLFWLESESIKDAPLTMCFVLSLVQGKNIVVFYGSQTGTAEEFANRLSKDSQRYGMKGMAADPEEYDMVIYIYGRIIIVMLD